MCELLGLTSANETLMEDYLDTFFSHSDLNPHGWGMMYEKDGVFNTVKEPVKALNSRFLHSLTKSLPPQKTMLAHIRLATVGNIKPDNCHPFSDEDISGRRWTMIHNGTIYSAVNDYRYYKFQSGETDSERLFLSFMDYMNDSISKHKTTERERFETVNEFVITHASKNKLNLMLFDSELLYVHKNLKNTLSFKRIDGGIIISTRPLDDGTWIPFPMAQVIGYKNGSEIYKGNRHRWVFVPSEEYIAAMKAINENLR